MFYRLTICLLTVCLCLTPGSALGASLTFDFGSASCSGGPGGCIETRLAEACNQLNIVLASGDSKIHTGLNTARGSLANTDGLLDRVALAPQPLWSNSVTWSGDSKRLIFSDVITKALAVYDLSGTMLRSEKDLSADFSPSAIQSTEDGYIVQNQPGEFLWLNDSLKVEKSVKLMDARNSRGKISSFWTWIVVGRSMISYSDIEHKGTWYSALVSIPIENPDAFQIIETTEFHDEMRGYYLFGFPYVVNIGGTVYFLKMEPKPYIQRIGVGLDPQRLKPFPQHLEIARPFTAGNSPADALKIYRELSNSTVPTGLYSWNDTLYILGRRPKGGKTEWLLTAVNVNSDTILGSFSLPTEDEHIQLVPGEESWAIIEKGPVIKLGLQPIHHVSLVSSEWIRKLSTDFRVTESH